METSPVLTTREPSLPGWVAGDGLVRTSYYVLAFAVPILVLRSGGPYAPIMSGVVSAAFYWPIWLLSIVAGTAVDRYHERRVVSLASGVRVLACILVVVRIVVSGWAWLLVVAALALGAAAVIHDVSLQAAPGRHFGANRLHTVNGALQAAASLTRTAGPALGGLALAVAGDLITMISMTVLALLGGVVLAKVMPNTVPEHADRRQQISPADGLREILRNPPVALTCGLSAIYNFSSQAFQTILIVYLIVQRGASELATGIVLGAAGIGVVAGSWIVGRAWAERWLQGQAMIWWLVAAMAVLPAALPVGGSVAEPWVLAFALLVNGVFLALYNTAAISLRQRTASKERLGSVMGTYRLVAMGAIPVGALVGGWIAQEAPGRGGLWAVALFGLLASTFLAVAFGRRVCWQDGSR